MFVQGTSFYFEDHQFNENIDNNVSEHTLVETLVEGSQEDFEIKNISISDKRIFVFEVPANIKGLAFKAVKMDCHKMVYFLSKSNDIKFTYRKTLKGLVELVFPSSENDMTINILESGVSLNSEINLNKRLAELNYRYKGKSTNYLYAVCPFLKSSGDGAEESKVEFEFEFKKLSNDELNDADFSTNLATYLTYQIQKQNSFTEKENPVDERTLYEKVKEEIIKAKSRAEMDEILSNLTSKYVNVFHTKLDISPLINQEETAVQKVELHTPVNLSTKSSHLMSKRWKSSS